MSADPKRHGWVNWVATAIAVLGYWALHTYWPGHSWVLYLFLAFLMGFVTAGALGVLITVYQEAVLRRPPEDSDPIEIIASPVAPKAHMLPYRWGKFFGVFSGIVCLLGIVWAVVKLILGQTIFALLIVPLCILLGVQAWGLLRKRKIGLAIFYFLCAIMLVDLVLSYTYMPSVRDSPDLVAWLYVVLYFGSVPYFLKRHHDFY